MGIVKRGKRGKNPRRGIQEKVRNICNFLWVPIPNHANWPGPAAGTTQVGHSFPR